MDNELLDADDERLDDYPGLAQWWRTAARAWNENRSSPRLSLIEQLNYMGKFTQQFPAPAHRVTYTKGGMHLAAARVDDARIVIDHKLYWAPVSGLDEGRYLTAIFNTDSFTLAVRGFQARGETIHATSTSTCSGSRFQPSTSTMGCTSNLCPQPGRRKRLRLP